MDAKTDQSMLDNRNTPSQQLTSRPVKRFISRRTKSVIPITAELLEQQVIKETDWQQARVKKQAKYYNVGAKLLPPLKAGYVRMKPYQLGDKQW